MEYKSFESYLKSLPPNTIFRVWERKLTFTPYEWEQKFSDQSLFENEECFFMIIKDTIILPDNDLLLVMYDCNDQTASSLNYYKLSEIALMKLDSDMEDE